jgi:hypothetical protein
MSMLDCVVGIIASLISIIGASLGRNGGVYCFVILALVFLVLKLIDNIEQRQKKQKDRVYSQYPCSVYLHDALSFISEGKPEAAYEEICWALTRAGAILSQNEYREWREICSSKEREKE